jgi:UDP-glucose 6-dehydrogenase
MRIVIIGAGHVDRELAQVLSVRSNDVIVIDRDELRLRELREGLAVEIRLFEDLLCPCEEQLIRDYACQQTADRTISPMIIVASATRFAARSQRYASPTISAAISAATSSSSPIVDKRGVGGGKPRRLRGGIGCKPRRLRGAIGLLGSSYSQKLTPRFRNFQLCRMAVKGRPAP